MQCAGPAAERRCSTGYESAERLDVEPAKYFVRVIKREKRACPTVRNKAVRYQLRQQRARAIPEAIKSKIEVAKA